MTRPHRIPIRLIVFVLALVPLALLCVRLWQSDLGANPVETLSHETGIWALRFLWLTLLITPLRRWSGWTAPIRVRRMLGLFAFFYASLHIAVYVVFDHFFALDAIIDDVVERPYISVGFAGFVLMIPLAATSTHAMMRRLGRRWKTLHRLAYAIAVLGLLHFLWQAKADRLEPMLYAGVLLAAFALRVVPTRRRSMATTR